MTLKHRLRWIALVAILALASAAPAPAVVPPGNSAVNQYTETFPTAGGAETTKQQARQSNRSPGAALSAAKIRKLAAAGPVGREVAAVVAATAPSTAQPDRMPGAGPSGKGRDKSSSGNGPDGSSGFREVIAQATGSSDSGQMGMLLPLLILAAIAGSALYLWRQRRQAA